MRALPGAAALSFVILQGCSTNYRDPNGPQLNAGLLQPLGPTTTPAQSPETLRPADRHALAPQSPPPSLKASDVPVQSIPAPSPVPSSATVVALTDVQPRMSFNPADAARDFERAESLVKSGHEDQALLSFADFLRRYPGHEKVDDAQFEIAEIYFQKRNYSQALTEYRKVFRIPESSSNYWADATLRAGDCLEKMGYLPQARVEWSAVVRRFPRTTAAQTAEGKLRSGGTL